MFKEVVFRNPESYEVLVAAGSMRGRSRKMLVVACYIPPNYSKQRGSGALEYVENILIELKRRYNDPYLFVAGDFNQWRVEDYLDNFPDVKEVAVGPTRGSRSIDRIFSNVGRSLVESGTALPLETEGEESRRSDHLIAYGRFYIEKKEAFKWKTFTFRRFNDGAVAAFKEWLVFYDWMEVLDAESADDKAAAYQGTLTEALDRFFPVRTVRRKSSDPPWMDRGTLEMIEDRRRLYIEEGGGTQAWKEEKKRTKEAVKERKRKYFDRQKDHLLASDANRNFYKYVKNFGEAERPKMFDVRELVGEGKTDEEIAEELAEYFNRISKEFEPLGPGDIPCTRDKDLPVLQEYEVATRIRKFRKPKSTVPGDIFPQLVTQFADFLAIPLTSIYNCITDTRRWSKCWKNEFVTVIPKKSCPESLSDLRNITCCLLYTSPSPRDRQKSRMPSSA